MRRFIPAMFTTPLVAQDTRIWWQEIGHSLVSFTEVEQGVIDWAVFFANDRTLWRARAMDDLKALVPELRRSLKKAGDHRLSADTRSAINRVLREVESLTNRRNDIAHMRLRFQSVPLVGTDDKWVPTASHVEVLRKRADRIEVRQHDLDWIRSARRDANAAALSLQTLMKQVATELGLTRSA